MSTAGYCMADSTALGGSFFFGVGAREGWEDIIVGWGQGLCATDPTESYKIDLLVDGSKIETGHYLNCDYSY